MSSTIYIQPQPLQHDQYILPPCRQNQCTIIRPTATGRRQHERPNNCTAYFEGFPLTRLCTADDIRCCQLPNRCQNLHHNAQRVLVAAAISMALNAPVSSQLMLMQMMLAVGFLWCPMVLLELPTAPGRLQPQKSGVQASNAAAGIGCASKSAEEPMEAVHQGHVPQLLATNNHCQLPDLTMFASCLASM